MAYSRVRVMCKGLAVGWMRRGGGREAELTMRALFLQLSSRGFCEDPLFLLWCCCLNEKWLAATHCFNSNGDITAVLFSIICPPLLPQHIPKLAPRLPRCVPYNYLCCLIRLWQQRLNMALHVYLHHQTFWAKQKPCQNRAPDKRPGYPGRQLSRAPFVSYMG